MESEGMYVDMTQFGPYVNLNDRIIGEVCRTLTHTELTILMSITSMSSNDTGLISCDGRPANLKQMSEKYNVVGYSAFCKAMKGLIEKEAVKTVKFKYRNGAMYNKCYVANPYICFAGEAPFDYQVEIFSDSIWADLFFEKNGK